MSRTFLAIVLALVTGFAGFETYINFHLRHVNNVVAEACFKPAHVPPVSSQAVFYIPAEKLR